MTELNLERLGKFIPSHWLPDDKDDLRNDLVVLLLENPTARDSTIREFIKERTSRNSSASKLQVGLTIVNEEGEEYERPLPGNTLPSAGRKQGRPRKDGKSFLRTDGRRRHGIIASLSTAQLREYAEQFAKKQMTLPQIAVACGLSPTGAYHAFKAEFLRRGIVLRVRRKAHTVPAAMGPIVRRLYESGLSLRASAKEVGVSWPTVRRLLSAEGVAIRPAHAHGAIRCRISNCTRQVFKQNRTYFDKRCGRDISTTFGSTCRFHYLLEVGKSSRRSYDKRHVRVRGAEQCQRGHAFSEENTYWYRGHRACKECRRATVRRYAATPEAKAKKKAREARALISGHEQTTCVGQAPIPSGLTTGDGL